MDWGRAKNVLIYAFLLLNLVLGYQLWMDMRDRAGASPDFTSLSGATQRMMEENRIQVLSPIPAETPQLPKISYTYRPDAQGDPVPLEQPVDTRLIYGEPKELQSAIGNQIADLEQYRHDPQSDRESTFVYRPLVHGQWPLFNVELELFHESQKIEFYREPVLEIEPTGDVEEQKVLSASKALSTLIERNVIPPRSSVKDIQLGYYGQMFDTEVELAAPAWRFTLDNGEMIYVQGISGDVFTPKKP
ncbi:two-component system regulatory protein YycI [Paenibacillus sp. F411]|uniref:two-component system regulatory protein YycI n=1 Tax=Paenibacillus sp. F411 TaxID=2820239 RepID=UPI001AAF07F8|nr:two-component system regulatory protein YycI [Paenibacillus sp. F411]MBO2944513.1 two-component system regulatory protein YycI [Paenibacillus sp. F411]